MTSRRRWRLLALLMALVLMGAAAACDGDDEDVETGTATQPAEEEDGAAAELPDLSGQSIEVAAVWTATEQERFGEVIAAFEERTGATVNFTSTGDDIAAVLTPRIQGGDPPDVAILPQPALLQQFADQGVLQPIEEAAGDLVDEHYANVWRELGTVNDTLFGVWFKASNKALMWYNIQVFEDAGVDPPEDWDGLLETAQTITDFGVPAFSVGGADGWTLTDWFENVYIRTAGPDLYEQLANHEIPWTDESVIDALNTLAEAWQPNLLAGGAAGALQTDFTTSVTQVFTEPPAAGIVYEADFVANVITGETAATLGGEADVFNFPEIEGSGPAVVGGGDVAVLMQDSEAGQAFIQWLAMPESAEVWAELGGFISPNQDVDVEVYPDDISQTIARGLIESGENFRFDLSDLQPPAFGSTTGQGMWGLFQDFVENPENVQQIAQQLEDAAAAAFQGQGG